MVVVVSSSSSCRRRGSSCGGYSISGDSSRSGRSSGGIIEINSYQ